MSAPRARRAHILGLALLLVVGLEAGSWLLLRLVAGLSVTDVRQRLTQTGPPASMEDLEAHDRGPDWLRSYALHPYVGFVGNPDHNGPLAKYVNEFGFYGEPPPVRGESDQTVIAITGGSVARNFLHHVRTRSSFEQELQELPAFAGKDVLIASFAIPGMKQPQQLMTLNYALSLGMKIDYLINLDGFNEVVLPYAENIPSGVFPFYPRSWHWSATKTISSGEAVQFGRIALSKARRYTWQRRLAVTPLRYSPFCLTAWHLLDRLRSARETAWEAELRGATGESGPANLQEHGPRYSAASMADVLDDSVAVWKRSSLQIWRLCAANGIQYLHALQPSQYLEGSKPLSEEEQRAAIGPPDFAFRRPAEMGFPKLRRVGQELQALGVPFEDLTHLFEKVDETIYIDTCCHLNTAGHDLVGKRILDRLALLTKPTGGSLTD